MRSIAVIAFFLFLSCAAYSQRGGGHRPGYGHRPYHSNKVVVIKRSPYRPRKMVVFHPVWAPKFAFYHRWVFWPGYNIYWDNWRNTYFFWNGGMWIASVSPPPAVVNNIQNEKHYEMKEAEDDVDDVYKNNSSHQKEYK